MDKSSGPRRLQEGGRKEAGAAEVYVGNLSWNAGEDDLRQLFAHCGRIVRVRVLKGEDGRSKGVGFVGFDAAEGVDAALRFDGSDYMGRTLRVSRSGERGPKKDPAEGARAVVSTSTVFVGNVSYQCSEEDLRELFSHAGEIKAIRMARDQEGRTKGFAHIEFADQEGVARAISYTNTDLKGRQIRVEYSKDSPSVRGRGAARPPGGWEQI